MIPPRRLAYNGGTVFPARFAIASAALLLAAPIDGQGIKIRDYHALVDLSSLKLSPNDKELAFVKQTQDFEADKRISSIVVARISDGTLTPLTDGGSPHWSPGGAQIAFTASGDNGRDQVFLIPASGGARRQLTHAKNGVQQFSWSPDGNRIAYVTPDDDPNADAIARHDGLFEIHDDSYLITKAAVSSHLWLIPANGGSAKRLTHGVWSVLETGAPFQGGPSDPSWSSDGKAITFARQATPNASDSDQTQVAVVYVDTGKVKLLSDRANYEYQPVFNGDLVAYIAPHGPTPLSVMDVSVTFDPDPDPGTTAVVPKVALSTSLDRDITSFAWVPNSASLVMMGPEGLRERLWIESGSGDFHRLPTSDLSVDQFAVGKGGLVAFVGSRSNTPPEIYVTTDGSKTPRQLTHLNTALTKFRYANSTEIDWTAPDGEKCDGVLTYPLDYKPERKYPLVIWNHGGPESFSPLAFADFEAGKLRQPLAADGYFVFEPNYRGSDNLGNAHEHAIFKDPGDGPYTDVMSGLIQVETTVSVDEDRISVAGHSYGGFITGWIIGHDHRWKCAVVADGALDWRDTYNLTTVGNMAWARDSLGGAPWDPEVADLYRTGSPLFYANQVTTPTLLLSGTADDTVPISESFAFYHALHDRGVAVKFIGVPGALHSPDDPVQNQRFNEVMEQWILQHDKP